ncbi:MAG: hypothetical protein ABW217_12120, partial [Polyangiaceae bacterium]
MLVAAALGALFSVACAGGDDRPGYAGEAETTSDASSAPVAASCETGTVRSCTIWLGVTGDLANCAKGVEICSEGAFGDCIDEETIAADPEL